MTAKLTKEVFVNRSKILHGNEYDYSKVEYINSGTKVDIFCKKHDITFSQSPNKHMAGQGCPKCRYEKTSKSNTQTQDQFISKSISVHGDKYEYSFVEYINCFVPVKIKCKIHDKVFEQKPNNHVDGKGCPLCAESKIKANIENQRLTIEDFIARAKIVHGDAYDYTDSKYVKSSSKIKIWCKSHGGYFEQIANSHLVGSGCASCAKTGYSTAKSGELYVLISDNLTKIGITNFKAEDRAKKISKSSGKNFKVEFKIRFVDGTIADTIETNMLRELRQKYLQPKEKFEGQSECFLNVDYKDLMQLFDKELNKIGAYQIDYN